MGLRDCISSALDRGAITKEEAAYLAAKAADYETLSGGEAKRAFAEDMRAEDLQRQKIETLTKVAQNAIYSDLRRFARFTGTADIVKAAYALFENFGKAGFQSYRSIREALLSQSLAEMNDFMETFRRNWTGKRLNRPMLDEVVRALFGEEAGPVASALAQSWKGVAEKLRAQFNEHGGMIGERADWAVPQSHDAHALLTAGKDKWVAYIEPRLDWDKIKRPITGLAVAPEERKALLGTIFDSIVTDGWAFRDPKMSPQGKGPLYKQRADARFLHFKNADAWLDYARQFGQGTPYAALVDHVSRLTRDVALMKRFGPNPAAMIEWLKQAVEAEAASYKIGKPSMFNGGFVLSTDAATRKARYMIDGFHDAARGSGMPFSRLGTAIGIVRNEEYSAKLGGAVLLHAFANPVIQAMGRYLGGHSLLRLPLDLARSFTRNEADEAGLILEDATHHLESGAREQSAWMKAGELARWLPQLTTHWSGLNAVAAASKRSAFLGQMTTFGKLAGTAFADLPERVRDGLQGFGVTEGLWDRIRSAPLYDAESRNPMLRPQDISDPEVQLAYYGLLHGNTGMLCPTSNMHVRAATAFANRSPVGREVVRSALMFKSGFMATFMLTQWQAIQHELNRNGAAAAGGYLMASAIGLTAAGMIVQQLKQMRAGKDLLPMDASEDGLKSWARAFLTGCALGIYGDFIASEMSSYGHGLTSTLAGPVVTGASDLFDLVGKAARRGYAAATGEKGPKGSEETDLLKVFRNNTPVLSTHWALSAAFNRVGLDQLQYLIDPQAHRNFREQELRIRRDTNQGFFWRPGELLPDRAPAFTMGR